jgi:hypothetical protein
LFPGIECSPTRSFRKFRTGFPQATRGTSLAGPCADSSGHACGSAFHGPPFSWAGPMLGARSIVKDRTASEDHRSRPPVRWRRPMRRRQRGRRARRAVRGFDLRRYRTRPGTRGRTAPGAAERTSRSTHRGCQTDAGVVRLSVRETIPIPGDRATGEGRCEPSKRGVQSNDITVVDCGGGVGNEMAQPQNASGVNRFELSPPTGTDRWAMDLAKGAVRPWRPGSGWRRLVV